VPLVVLYSQLGLHLELGGAGRLLHH
jgi:hypothetical protein